MKVTNNTNFERLLLVFGFILLWVTAISAHAASCGAWPDCNAGLVANPVPSSGFGNYRRLIESPHFNLSIDTTSRDINRIDLDKVKTLVDQLECSYRYLVCEKNIPPSSQIYKTPVYIGDYSGFWGSGGTAGHIRVNDNLLLTGLVNGKLFTVPPHEFFHVLQYAMIYTPYNNISEGLSALVEGIISETNYQYAERTEAFHRPQYPTAYGHETFWRYVFEQLNEAPAPGSRSDEDYAVEKYLPALLQHLVDAGSSPRPDMYQLLSTFIPQNANVNSLQNNLNDMMDNYMTMRYAIGRGQVDASRYPRYYLFRSRAPYRRNSIDVKYATSAFANKIELNRSIYLYNTDRKYLSSVPFFGFNQFLAAEYHPIAPDLSRVTQLRFNKMTFDDDIRFQLIMRYADGKIIQKRLMQYQTVESIWLQNSHDIKEIVLVVYTTNPNPYVSGAGRTYAVRVIGK